MKDMLFIILINLRSNSFIHVRLKFKIMLKYKEKYFLSNIDDDKHILFLQLLYVNIQS